MSHAKTGLQEYDKRIDQFGGNCLDLYIQQQTTTRGQDEKQKFKGIEVNLYP